MVFLNHLEEDWQIHV